MGKNVQYALLMMAVGAVVVWLLGRECSRQQAPSTDTRPVAPRESNVQPRPPHNEANTTDVPCVWQGHECRTAFDYSNVCYLELKAKSFAAARANCDRGQRLDATNEIRAMLSYNRGLIECHDGNFDAARSEFAESLKLRPSGSGAEAVRVASSMLDTKSCRE